MILGIVGFLIGGAVVGFILNLLVGALKPTLPSITQPTRKVVVRKRVIQVRDEDSLFSAATVARPRPRLDAQAV